MRHNEEWIELCMDDGTVEVFESAVEAWDHYKDMPEYVQEIWWVKKEGDEIEIGIDQLELWAENEEDDEDYSGDDMLDDFCAQPSGLDPFVGFF